MEVDISQKILPGTLEDDRAADAGNPLFLRRITAAIDGISVWSGKIVGLFIFPMMISLVYEVVARYFFNAPTIWANDIATMFYGAFFMLGSAYTLQRQQHIRTDFLYDRWSTRTKGIIDSVMYIFFYFPGLGIFLWIGWNFALRSTMLQERIVSSPWMPYVWPLKLALPLATLMLLLQGVSELIKCLHAASTGIDFHGKKENIET